MAVLAVIGQVLLWILAAIGALLALVLLLLCLPIYLRFSYRQEQTELTVRVCGIALHLLPPKPKKEKKKKPRRTKKEPTGEKKENIFARMHRQWKQDGVKALISTYLYLAKLAVRTVGKLLRAPIIDRLRVRLSVTGSEPDQTAVQYGKMCALLYPAQAVLESKMRFRDAQVQVIPDFIGSKMQAEVDLKAHIYPIRAVGIALWALIKFITGTTKTNKREEEQNGKQSQSGS